MSIVYRCDICHMAENREPLKSPAAGTDDDSARAAGWRIGASKSKPRNVICPECAGTDNDYWDRRLINVAHKSGMAGLIRNHSEEKP
jgi:hypothetical protein